MPKLKLRTREDMKKLRKCVLKPNSEWKKSVNKFKLDSQLNKLIEKQKFWLINRIKKKLDKKERLR